MKKQLSACTKKYIIAAGTLICAGYLRAQSYYEDILRFREKYKEELFSIIKQDTAYITFFPVDEKMKVIGRVQRLENEPIFKMATSSGIKREAQKIAVLIFSIDNKTYKLNAYQLLSVRSKKEYANHFFVPFIDESSGLETYGAGRYMDFTLDDIKDNTLVIDFNKAYNPYCAFTVGYNCPVPPRENHLKIAIHAGEMNFQKATH